MLIHQVVRGESIYQPIDERRAELSFSKNTLMNWIAPRSLVASAVLAQPPGADAARIRERALFLSRLLKLELTYRVEGSFESIFDATVDAMERDGLLSRGAAGIAAAPERSARPRLEFLADLLRDFLESYWIAGRALDDLAAHGVMDRRSWVRSALELARAEFLAGRISTMEAISRPNLENALAWFVDRGVVEAEDRKVRLAPDLDEAARVALAQEIRAFLC
jgi:glycerol-3-phosphate O-acyltransferase